MATMIVRIVKPALAAAQTGSQGGIAAAGGRARERRERDRGGVEAEADVRSPRGQR
jgi:hypothetical protein